MRLFQQHRVSILRVIISHTNRVTDYGMIASYFRRALSFNMTQLFAGK
jgi:hypothetical protein